MKDMLESVYGAVVYSRQRRPTVKDAEGVLRALQYWQGDYQTVFYSSVAIEWLCGSDSCVELLVRGGCIPHMVRWLAPHYKCHGLSGPYLSRLIALYKLRPAAVKRDLIASGGVKVLHSIVAERSAFCMGIDDAMTLLKVVVVSVAGNQLIAAVLPSFLWFGHSAKLKILAVLALFESLECN
jgi:hypothetical protein